MEREPPLGCSDSENEKSRLEVLESERNKLQKSMMTLTSRLAQVNLGVLDNRLVLICRIFLKILNWLFE